jgi:membrane-associated phospholipid phosphatase
VILRGLFGLRPADTLNLSFLFFLTGVTLFFAGRIPSIMALVLGYTLLIICQILLIFLKDRNSVLRFIYDLAFPTISILIIFDSLEQIVHFINPRDIDPLLVKLDYLLFGDHPTVLMERIMSPLLTDILQIAYTSYYILPVTLGIVLLSRQRPGNFDYALFMIMLCFYLSYLGYMVTPAIGPRFTINHMQTMELKGLVLAEPVQQFLNRLEGIKRDAFPSGHTGIALTVLCLSWRFEKKLFLLFLPLVAGLIFSTVYLRYHYVVDVIAGAMLPALTLLLGDRYYGYWEKRINPGR